MPFNTQPRPAQHTLPDPSMPPVPPLPKGLKEYQVQCGANVVTEVRRVEYSFRGVDYPELDERFEVPLIHLNGSVTIVRSALAPF